MQTWRGFGTSPSAPPSPTSPFLTPPRGPSSPSDSWLSSDGQARGWRVSAAAAAIHSPGSRSPNKASSRSPHGAGGGGDGSGGGGLSGGMLPLPPSGSPGRRGASPGPNARNRRRRLLLAAAAGLLAAASLVLFFIQPQPPPSPARREAAVTAVQEHSLRDKDRAVVLRVFPIEDAVRATPAAASAAVRDSDGGGGEPPGDAMDGGIATGTTAATRPQLPETKEDGSKVAATTATTATASPLHPSVMVDGAANAVGSLASIDREVISPSAPGAVEDAGDVGGKAGLRHDVMFEDLRMEEMDAAAGEAATAEVVPKANLVMDDGGDGGGGDGGGGRGDAGSSAAVAAGRATVETVMGERKGMSALQEGQAAAALMHDRRHDHSPGHDQHQHHHVDQHLQQRQQHGQRDAGGEESMHKQQQQQPQLQRRRRKQRQQQRQPAEAQREDLYDTRSKNVLKESKPDHAALLTVVSLPASGDTAAWQPGAGVPGFGPRPGRVNDEGATAAGGGSSSASTAADDRSFADGDGGTAEAEDAGVYGHSVTGGGSGALRQAREALARYRGGGIPQIIHQMYGLFDTPPPPGRRDRLIGLGLNPDSNPDQATATAAPRRKLHQQQQQQWLQGQQQRVRSLQGWSGGPEMSIQSWRHMNPGYTHILWGPGDVDELVEVMFPAFAPAFRSFQRMPVLRADLARYLVVFAFGGVYADTDTLCLRPVDGWTDGLAPNVSAIVGVEADAGAIPHWERFWGRQLQFCQWTFAAEPAHPLLAHVVFRISQLLEQRPADQLMLDDVIHVTGPSVMSDAVYDYLKSKGRDWHEFEGLAHGTLVGDLLVLPITAFSPGVGHMGAGPVGHPEARVQHLFGGSWRTQGFATHGSGNNNKNNNNNNLGP